MNKSFLVLFFKKEQKKALLFEKRSKNFLSIVLRALAAGRSAYIPVGPYFLS
jgi:hypothetical protein